MRATSPVTTERPISQTGIFQYSYNLYIKKKQKF